MLFFCHTGSTYSVAIPQYSTHIVMASLRFGNMPKLFKLIQMF